MKGVKYSYLFWIIVIPVVHLTPLHPAEHAQVLGDIQVPPFGQDVTPKHNAEKQNIA